MSYIKYSFLIFILALSFVEVQAGQCGGPLRDVDALFTQNVLSAVPKQIAIENMEEKTGVSRTLEYVELRTKGEAEFSEPALFTDNSDLIIGVDVTGNTHGHMYMIINGARYDGRMFWAPSTVKKSDWRINKGLIIRYKGMPEANKQKLIEYMSAEENATHTATCVAGACTVLYQFSEFGIDPGKLYWFPANYLKYLAENGLYGKDGVRLQPTIYTINHDINLFWDNLPTLRKVPSFIFKVLLSRYTWEGLLPFLKKKDGEK